MNSFLEPANLLKLGFFLGIFQEFCLKVPEDFFHHSFNFHAFTEHLLVSLYICSNGKYVVHGLFKIIQNYVNNKINN